MTTRKKILIAAAAALTLALVTVMIVTRPDVPEPQTPVLTVTPSPGLNEDDDNPTATPDPSMPAAQGDDSPSPPDSFFTKDMPANAKEAKAQTVAFLEQWLTWDNQEAVELREKRLTPFFDPSIAHRAGSAPQSSWWRDGVATPAQMIYESVTSTSEPTLDGGVILVGATVVLAGHRGTGEDEAWFSGSGFWYLKLDARTLHIVDLVEPERVWN